MVTDAQRTYQHNWYIKNRERKRASYIRNRKRLLAYAARRRAMKSVRKYRAQYQREYAPVYYQLNRDTILARNKAYSLLHPEVHRRGPQTRCKRNPAKVVANNARKTVMRRNSRAANDKLVGCVIGQWRKTKTFICFYCH